MAVGGGTAVAVLGLERRFRPARVRQAGLPGAIRGGNAALPPLCKILRRKGVTNRLSFGSRESRNGAGVK